MNFKNLLLVASLLLLAVGGVLGTIDDARSVSAQTEVKYRSIPIDEDGNYVGPSKNQFAVYTGSGAMDETLQLTPNAVLVSYKLHLSSAQVTSENLTAQDDGTGWQFVNYDMETDFDKAETYEPQIPFKAGTTLRFEFANSDTRTWHLELVWREER